MGKRSLDKELIYGVLEAIQKALGHLGRVKLNAARSPALDEDKIRLLYTRVRRLQDYMHLANAACSGMVEIDLTDVDDNLVASCLLHVLGEGEVRGIRRGVVTGKAGAWTKEQAEMLATLTIEFSNRPVEFLPGVSPAHSRSLLVQRVLRDISQRSSRDPDSCKKSRSSSAVPTSAGVSDFGRGIEGEAGFAEGAKPQHLDFAELHARATGALHRSEGSRSKKTPRLDSSSFDRSEEDEVKMEEGFLLDPRSIRDPRLRKMMVEDMRGLRRCRRAQDYRMASIHLCAVLEQVTLEYAMPRASELGLVGPIDSWRLPVVLVQLLGDDLDKGDRRLLGQILTTRSQLYPAVQLRRPRETTADTLSSMLQLVHQMLACLSMKAKRV